MKIEELKYKKDERYCVRCGYTEKDVRKNGSGGCYPMGGYYKNHSYITDRELEKFGGKSV